ncbi:uncharacterized protein aq_1476-like [Ranitomeya imitator]|uniref:uncharacterized protein aq_1476-like n=1 Tax=Ranitomeya imitator TaxID=111125 RepID=UPI0037E98EC3
MWETKLTQSGGRVPTVEIAVEEPLHDIIESLKENLTAVTRQLEEVCQQLANERVKVLSMETTNSAQLNQACHLESELSVVKAQVGKKEAQYENSEENLALESRNKNSDALKMLKGAIKEHVEPEKALRQAAEHRVDELEKEVSEVSGHLSTWQSVNKALR